MVHNVIPHSIGGKMNTRKSPIKKAMLCPKCLTALHTEKDIDIDYPYVCKRCDENFYEFECKQPNTKEKLC